MSVIAADPAQVNQAPETLEQAREAFASRRFLAMPLAGTVAWLVIAAGGVMDLGDWQRMLLTYVATGCIAYLGMALSYLTGERFMDKVNRDNPFSKLFMATISMSLLVFAIAIPFAQAEPSSLPLSLAVLSGLMWLPLSWIIRHWIGAAHAVARSVLVLVAWYAFPEQRFVAVPLVVVALYAITMVVLELRWRALQRPRRDRGDALAATT